MGINMISIIICSINPKKFKNITLSYTALMGKEPFEIIGIHDAKSLCEGYNRGIHKSVGEILIFSHDDIEILSPDFVTRLKNHLKNFDIVGFAGTNKAVDGYWFSAGTPHIFGVVGHLHETKIGVSCYDAGAAGHQGRVATGGIKMMDGLFFAVRRSVVRKVLFDEEIFDGFHGYDADFTYSAFLEGFSLGVCNDIAVIHASGGNYNSLFHLYKKRFNDKHSTTLAAPESLARFEILHASCANKQDVLHFFSLETQKFMYDQWVSEKKQAPLHDQHNPDLLAMIPLDAKRVIEIGCSSGALARAYRELNPSCEYIGTENDPSYTEIARQHCSEVMIGNIEQMLDEIQTTQEAFDCWIFGNALPHIYDPWRLLKRIAQELLMPGGSVVACIPNMQHWQMQFALNVGNLQYQESGLLDRTHIRWFTRVTIMELFQQAGLHIDHIDGLIFNEPQREIFMPLLRDLAEASGGDPDQAVADATPLQWVVHATLPRP